MENNFNKILEKINTNTTLTEQTDPVQFIKDLNDVTNKVKDIKKRATTLRLNTTELGKVETILSNLIAKIKKSVGL